MILVSFGPRLGESKIFRKDGTTLLKSFIDKKAQALGPSAEETILKDNKEIRDERKRLKEAEKKLKEAEQFALERQKAANEVLNLRGRIEKTQSKIDALEEEHGSNLENQNEIDRLKRLKKIFKVILKTIKKNLPPFRKHKNKRTKNRQMLTN